MYLPFWQESLPKIILEFAKYCIMNRRERKSRGTILQTNWIWTNNLVLFFSLSLHTQESHKITITARVETHIHVVGKGQSLADYKFHLSTDGNVGDNPPSSVHLLSGGGGGLSTGVYSVNLSPINCFFRTRHTKTVWLFHLNERFDETSSFSLFPLCCKSHQE